jgi:hypothetical protein
MCTHIEVYEPNIDDTYHEQIVMTDQTSALNVFSTFGQEDIYFV